jgi:hypothetical protein
VLKNIILLDRSAISQTSDYLSQRLTKTTFQNGSWIVLSSLESRIKSKIENIGKPLKDWDIQINYGIKTGFNEAFIISGEKRNELIEKCPEADKIIRPILLGKNIKRFSFEWDGLWLINTHNGVKSKGIPRIKAEEDYPIIYNYLLKYRDALEKRLDQGDHWTNLRNCAYVEDFTRKKIGWGNLALRSQFSFIPGDYLINAPSPFFATESFYLLAVLNSKLADYYIKQLGISRNGGYFEYKPMFVERLPIPIIERKQEEEFELIIKEILNLKKDKKETQSLEQVLDAMIYNLYKLLPEEIEVLERDFIV